jgi:hypothetical protein
MNDHDEDVSLTPRAALGRMLGDYLRPGVGVSADRLVRAGVPEHIAPHIASASAGIRTVEEARAAAERFGRQIVAFLDEDPTALARTVPRP